MLMLVVLAEDWIVGRSVGGFLKGWLRVARLRRDDLMGADVLECGR